MTFPPRWITGAAMLLIGLGLLLWPGQYVASGYHVVFDIMPRRAWGAAFTTGAACLFAARRPLTMFVAVLVLASWSIGLLAAVFTGDAQSLTGWVYPAALAGLLVWGASNLPGV